MEAKKREKSKKYRTKPATSVEYHLGNSVYISMKEIGNWFEVPPVIDGQKLLMRLIRLAEKDKSGEFERKFSRRNIDGVQKIFRIR